MNESLKREYERLSDEMHVIQSQTLKGGPTLDRFREIRARLCEILASPPEGYALPSAAETLISHARTHGWKTSVEWTSTGGREVFATVRVGRRVLPEETTGFRGDRWKFSYTWHSRGCAPGRLRLFGSGLAETPSSPRTHDAPSLKKTRQIIHDNPGLKEITE